MRSLLDVNILIALLDSDHTLHTQAIEWFARNAGDGWSSCPITQNGCVRIMCHPGYPNALPAHAVIESLRAATSEPQHEFWPDNITVTDAKTVDAKRMHGPRQLTDIYLLALAVRNNGRLVTFDSSIALEAARGARDKHLLKL